HPATGGRPAQLRRHRRRAGRERHLAGGVLARHGGVAAEHGGDEPAAGVGARLTAAIIIFGAAVRPDGSASPTLRRRVEAAARLGARLEAPLYLPTGARGRFGAAES